MFSIRLVTLIFVASLLSACGSSQTYPVYSRNQPAKNKLVKVAKKYLGVPYRYGGSSPRSGFDCSGLVQYAHQQVGIELPRTTGGQYRSVMPLPRQSLRAGDLVFFKTKFDRFVSHVGIYLGNHRFIHAPSSGKRVTIASMKNPYWKKRFTAGGRVY